jgi:hypothetical protein
MSKERKYLNNLGLKYEEPIRLKAFIIEPKSMRYNIQIALIVLDKDENYLMMLSIHDDVKKEIKFSKLSNILLQYNSLYALGRRILDNQYKIKFK